MKLATYNVANLFERARILDLPTWSEGRPILEAYARLPALLAQPRYTATTRRRILTHLATLGLGRADTSRFARLRQNRGKLRARRDGKLGTRCTNPVSPDLATSATTPACPIRASGLSASMSGARAA